MALRYAILGVLILTAVAMGTRWGGVAHAEDGAVMPPPPASDPPAGETSRRGPTQASTR